MLAALLLFAVATGAQLFAPWWIGVMPAFLIGFALSRGPVRAFASGFVGLGLVWLLAAGYQDWQNQGILARRMAEMLSLPHPTLLLVLTGLVGAMLGGLGCWAGYGLKGALLDPRDLREEGWG